MSQEDVVVMHQASTRASPDNCVIGVLPGCMVRPLQEWVQPALRLPALGSDASPSIRRTRPSLGIAARSEQRR